MNLAQSNLAEQCSRYRLCTVGQQSVIVQAEQYRMQAQGSKPSSQQEEEEQQQQPAAEPSPPKPAEKKPDAAAEQRHMLWYQGKERGTKLSQSSVLSQREMDMIELGGAP